MNYFNKKFLMTMAVLAVAGFGLLGMAGQAQAVREFKSSVKSSGGDYASLSAAEDGLDYVGTADLTSSNYKTAAYTVTSGDPTGIIDAEAVIWDAGASSGNMIHITTSAKSGTTNFFLYSTQALTAGDVIDDGDGNTITVSGTPDTAQITIKCYAMQDTTAVTIDGWTTDATRYIKIVGDNTTGKWDESKYRLDSIASTIITVSENYVYIIGLQIKASAATGSQICIDASGSDYFYLGYNILFRSVVAGSGNVGINIESGSGSHKYVYNNIFYDISGSVQGHAIYDNSASGCYIYAYNNTFYACDRAFTITNGSRTVLKNNLIAACGEATIGSISTASDYNVTDLSSFGAGYTLNTHDHTLHTFTFVDKDGDNFHLASGDIGAIDLGINDPGSGLYSDDIDGQTRSGTWDAGADEYYVVATPGITVNPTAGLTTTEAGGTDTFTVVLNTQPTANVTIGLSSSDTTEGTVSPSSLTFTSANWSTPQTVTATGVDDSIDDGNIAYTIITAAASSSDASYNGVNASDVSVTNMDNDPSTIWCNPANTGTEDGLTKTTGYNTLWEAMTAMAAGDTVIIADGNWVAYPNMSIYDPHLPPSGSAGSPDIYSKIKAETDWDVRLPLIMSYTIRSFVEIRGIVFDSRLDADQSHTHVVNRWNHIKFIRCGFLAGKTSGNSHTCGFGSSDNTRSENQYNLMEECIAWGGGRYVFYNKYGQYNIFRRCLARHDYNAQDAYQMFNFRSYACDYSIYQNCISIDSDRIEYYSSPLYVESGGFWAGDSYGATGNELHGCISIKDVQYSYYMGGNGTGAAVIENSIALDNTVGVSAGACFIKNSGVDLDVSNFLGLDGLGGLNQQTGVFTAINSILKNLTNFGTVGEIITSYINHFNAGTGTWGTGSTTYDPEENGLLYPVRIEAGSPLATAGFDGGRVGPEILYQIGRDADGDGISGLLYGEPGYDELQDGQDGRALRSLWPFPNEDKIKELMSDTVEGVSGTYGFTAYQSPFGSPASLTSYIWEYLGNQIPGDIYGSGITVTPTSGLATTEAGGTDTFTVVLNTQPTANVTIGLSSSDTTEGTVSPSSLTFTSSNWSTPQTVTATGVDDSIDDGNIAYTIVTAAASSSDANYNNVNASDVSVTNTDDDTAGVTVTPTAGLGDSTHDDNINKEAVPAIPKKTDLNPQGDFSILINGNSEYTNSRTIKLKLLAGSDTKYMLLSQNSNFTGAKQEKYTPDKIWTLSKGDGKKNIYAKFLTLYDVASKVVSDSIILDTTAPPLSITDPKNYSSLTDNTPTITGTSEPDASIILELQTEDGAKSYYSTDTDENGNWDYTFLTPLTNQDYILKVTAQDQAGNLSKAQTIHFKIQTQKVSLVPEIPALSPPISPPAEEEQEITPPSIPKEQPSQEKEEAVPSIPEKEVSLPPLNLQSNLLLLKSLYGNISLKPASSEAPLTLVSGQTLKSFVKPKKPVKAVKVTIIFQKPAEKDTSYESKNSVLSSILGIPSAQAQTWRIAEYTLTDENNDGIYEGEITLPETTGTYLIRTTLFYADGTLENLDTETLIDPKGYIYTPASNNQQTRINKAAISLYVFNANTSEFEVWDSAKYDQQNPQETDQTGEYEFLVPEGRYYLQITAKGYQPYKGEEFQAQEGDVIHQNIELAPVKKFNLKWLILPGIIMMVLIVGVGIGFWKKGKPILVI